MLKWEEVEWKLYKQSHPLLNFELVLFQTSTTLLPHKSFLYYYYVGLVFLFFLGKKMLKIFVFATAKIPHFMWLQFQGI